MHSNILLTFEFIASEDISYSSFTFYTSLSISSLFCLTAYYSPYFPVFFSFSFCLLVSFRHSCSCWEEHTLSIGNLNLASFVWLLIHKNLETNTTNESSRNFFFKKPAHEKWTFDKRNRFLFLNSLYFISYIEITFRFCKKECLGVQFQFW